MQEQVNEIVTKTTILGTLLSFATENTSVLTLIVFTATGIASIIFGYRNSTANIERNRINKRDITNSIIKELEKTGKDKFCIDDLDSILKK